MVSLELGRFRESICGLPHVQSLVRSSVASDESDAQPSFLPTQQPDDAWRTAGSSAESNRASAERRQPTVPLRASRTDA